MGKFKEGDRVKLLKEFGSNTVGEIGIVRNDQTPEKNNDDKTLWIDWVESDWGFLVYYKDIIQLIKEADMELKDDDVIRKGDQMHWSDNDITSADDSVGKTVSEAKKYYEYRKRGNGYKLLKVTRPGGKKGEKKMKEKAYPKRFYVQFNCPRNDDDMSLRASSDPQDFDIGYPMLEVKDGKVTEVMVETKTVVKVKKVK